MEQSKVLYSKQLPFCLFTMVVGDNIRFGWKIKIVLGYLTYIFGNTFCLFVSICMYRGGYSKPSYMDVLWIQLVFFPYYTVMYVNWYIRWIWKFTIRKEEFGEEEKLYLIRKYLKLSTSQFDVSWVKLMFC